MRNDVYSQLKIILKILKTNHDNFWISNNEHIIRDFRLKVSIICPFKLLSENTLTINVFIHKRLMYFADIKWTLY